MRLYLGSNRIKYLPSCNCTSALIVGCRCGGELSAVRRHTRPQFGRHGSPFSNRPAIPQVVDSGTPARTHAWPYLAAQTREIGLERRCPAGIRRGRSVRSVRSVRDLNLRRLDKRVELKVVADYRTDIGSSTQRVEEGDELQVRCMTDVRRNKKRCTFGDTHWATHGWQFGSG